MIRRGQATKPHTQTSRLLPRLCHRSHAVPAALKHRFRPTLRSNTVRKRALFPHAGDLRHGFKSPSPRQTPCIGRRGKPSPPLPPHPPSARLGGEAPQPSPTCRPSSAAPSPQTPTILAVLSLGLAEAMSELPLPGSEDGCGPG